MKKADRARDRETVEVLLHHPAAAEGARPPKVVDKPASLPECRNMSNSKPAKDGIQRNQHVRHRKLPLL